LPAFCWYVYWENHDFSLGKMHIKKELVYLKDTKEEENYVGKYLGV